ncbi:MAG: prepilin-type N-terminal cleavage/methylation domain-containing protein, partial [Bacteroidota bacterium]
MKKRQTYLKGFTLIELLVTLSLVGVVLLMGNAVFRIFDRMQYQYVGELDDQTEAGVLCAYIRDQVRVAHTYTWQDDTLYLKKRDAQIFAKIYQEDNLTIS